MPIIPKETALTLERLNSKARWKARGNQSICEIVGFNGKPYATGTAANDDDSLALALAEALKVGAPDTPDQAAAKYGKLTAEGKAKDARIAELEAQLAAAAPKPDYPPPAPPVREIPPPADPVVPVVPTIVTPAVEVPQIPTEGGKKNKNK
jgi:hypothetical protein